MLCYYFIITLVLIHCYSIARYERPFLQIITRSLSHHYSVLLPCSLLRIIAMLLHITFLLSLYYCVITTNGLFITASLLRTYFQFSTWLCLHYYTITTNLILNYYDWLFHYYMAPFQIYYFMITSITTTVYQYYRFSLPHY